ncbi:acetoacetate--CoA ligase [Microbacterium sp. NPDC077644]|uniref:acetoacetate--CoA ligase n=1 Tax=Microbacterium sp. NPDC077644 TaxID=3155055 RepID=UPI00344B7F35
MSEGPEQLIPAPERPRDESETARYLTWLAAERGLRFADFAELQRWSVEHLEDFWQSIWDFFEVISHAPAASVLAERVMPGARWFEGTTLNFAEHALRAAEEIGDDVAIHAFSQSREDETVTFGELRERVAHVAAGLVELGVGRGDRVAAYLPNIPEAVIAYLATASLGAIWASCAPEFGVKGVLDRLGQIEPKVLFAVDGYRYGSKDVDRRADVQAIREGLAGVEHVIGVRYLAADVDDALPWTELVAIGARTGRALEFEAVPFDHPLSVLFTSGTTGLPKPIVHGHGGIILEHFKNHALHWDLGPGDRLMWFSTTSWMVWNAVVSALMLRASIVLIDGNPMGPDPDLQWRLIERWRPTVVGLSAGFLLHGMREQREPAAEFDLGSIRQLGVVGSPLPTAAFDWVHAQFGDDVLLNVGSGGTDVCTGLVQGGPWQPVWRGEMAGASLGVDVCAFDDRGDEVVGELGELVVRAPMPSMPVGFWGDEDGSRYRAAYFDTYPGVWRHGDWIRFSAAGSCIITGRSDATLNRGGVRLGTADFYGVVDAFAEVADSLVVHLDDPDGGNGELLLFVVPVEGHVVDDSLVARLRSAIRDQLSPRHTPDRVLAVAGLPHTRTGKKLEVPVKRILLGRPLAEAVDPDAVDDASALQQFVDLAAAR